MSYYFLCSQNNDSKNYRFIQSVFSDFIAAEFPKIPSPKPARIPPQTPPAGGKSAEAGRIHSPRQIVSPCRVRFNHLDFARNSFELCPANTARLNISYFLYEMFSFCARDLKRLSSISTKGRNCQTT
jgi:hypothetical protein